MYLKDCCCCYSTCFLLFLTTVIMKRTIYTSFTWYLQKFQLNFGPSDADPTVHLCPSRSIAPLHISFPSSPVEQIHDRLPNSYSGHRRCDAFPASTRSLQVRRKLLFLLPKPPLSAGTVAPSRTSPTQSLSLALLPTPQPSPLRGHAAEGLFHRIY